jgi:hypothetical protein
MFSITGNGFASRCRRTINQTADHAALSLTRTSRTNRSGLYVQEQLGWKRSCVPFTGALRFDDNSTFGTLLRSAGLPEAFGDLGGLRRSFFRGVPESIQLKLRGAWGKAGQQPNTFAA